MSYVKKTHWGGFFRFRDTQQLSGIERLLQDPLVADTDWNQANVKDFPFKEWIHYNIQQAYRRTQRRGGQSLFVKEMQL